MNCPYCGRYVGKSGFCVFCGEYIEKSELNDSTNNDSIPIKDDIFEENNYIEKSNVDKNNANIKFQDCASSVYKFGMIVGIAIFVLGIIFYFVNQGAYSGGNVSYEIYGGDAYTGIQHAAAQTADNILHLSKIVIKGISCIVSSFGAVSFCYFCAKYKNANKWHFGK